MDGGGKLAKFVMCSFWQATSQQNNCRLVLEGKQNNFTRFMGYLTGWEGKELPCCPPWLPVAIVSLLCLLQVVLCHAAATRLTTNELQACSRDTVTVKKRQGSGVFEEGAQIKPLFSHLFKSRSFKKKKKSRLSKGHFFGLRAKGQVLQHHLVSICARQCTAEW